MPRSVAAWAAGNDLHVGPYAGAAIGVAVGFGASLLTYFIIVRPLQQTRKIREEEKEIFILTATLLWGIMIQELIAYFYTNNAKTVAPIVEGVVAYRRRAHAVERDLHRRRVLAGDRRCSGSWSTAPAPARRCWPPR